MDNYTESKQIKKLKYYSDSKYNHATHEKKYS